MIETHFPMLIEGLGESGDCSCVRTDFSFPAAHWKISFPNSDQLDVDRVHEVCAHLQACGFEAVTARQLSDTAYLAFARCSKAGFHTVSVPTPFTPNANAMLRSPRGLLLAIFGPDGVGKSSVLSAAVNALSPLFDSQRILRWRPQLVSSRVAKEANKFRLPHSAELYSVPISFMKLGGAFLDFYLDHLTSTRNHLRGSSLIAWDRYFHDLAVDTTRHRYRGPEWYPEFLLRLFPVPKRFLGIVLDADEELILSRKHELPFDEIRRQRFRYQQLANRLPRTYVVKNELAIQDCVQEVLSIVTKVMATWFHPMLRDSPCPSRERIKGDHPLQVLAG